MQSIVTITLTLAGLFFSLMCALLLEELLFGTFFRMMAADAARRRSKSRQRFGRETEIPQGGVTCSH